MRVQSMPQGLAVKDCQDGKGSALPGDVALGKLLRELRTARQLTLAVVARHAGCAESLISLVETGKRQIQPWLADRLDVLYGTGGTLVALLNPAYAGNRNEGSAQPLNDVLLVCLPQRGTTVALSRRGVLAALGIGALSGSIFRTLDQALGQLQPTAETAGELEHALDSFQYAARVMAPTSLVDPLISQIAVLDVLRQP